MVGAELTCSVLMSSGEVKGKKKRYVKERSEKQRCRKRVAKNRRCRDAFLQREEIKRRSLQCKLTQTERTLQCHLWLWDFDFESR